MLEKKPEAVVRVVRIRIQACICASKFQDKTYGKGMRVHNAMGSMSIAGWRCSVCSKETVVK